VLSTHPQVRITRELQAFRQLDVDLLSYLHGLRWSWWSRDYMDLGGRPRRKRWIRSARFVARFGARLLSSSPRSVGLGAIRTAYRDAFPMASVVGDKDPDCVFLLDRLVHLQEIRCIVIYRDGRDVIHSSLIEANSKWVGHPLAAETDTPAKVAERWTRAIACQERHAAQILTVRYEDFVTQPAPVVGRLGAYLGVDPGGFRTEQVRPSSIGKHRGNLTGADLERIEEIAGPTLRRLGYL
jgi:hypothetical protein